MERILLVEDAVDFQNALRTLLEKDKRRVDVASNAAEAFRFLNANKFDLILLDISLPDRNGITLFCELRSNPQHAETPVIFVTGSAEDSDKVTAFSLGAEDYIVKPFSYLELKARIDARLQKAALRKQRSDVIKVGGLTLDVALYQADLNEEGVVRKLDLTPTEFKLLVHLARAPEQVFSREQILNVVWGNHVHVSTRAVDANISAIRKKLGTS